MVEEIAEEIKGMKKILKKIYEMGQMMWGEVVDLNDKLELGYKSSEAGTEGESDEESGSELEVGEEEQMEVEEERKVLRREVNRWEAKQAAEQVEKQAAEAAKELSGSKYGVKNVFLEQNATDSEKIISTTKGWVCWDKQNGSRK